MSETDMYDWIGQMVQTLLDKTVSVSPAKGPNVLN